MVIGIAEAKPDRRTAPRAEECDQGLHLGIAAHPGPGIEPKPRLVPIDVAIFMPARAGHHIGRKSRRDARFRANRDREIHLFECDHFGLLAKQGQPVAQHLRQGPQEHFADAARPCRKRRIDDPVPLRPLACRRDKARQIMLLSRRIAEPRIDLGQRRRPQPGPPRRDPLIILELEHIERGPRPAERQIGALHLGRQRVERSGQINQQQRLRPRHRSLDRCGDARG